MFLLAKNKTVCLRNKSINYPWGIAFACKSLKVLLKNYFLYVTCQDVADCCRCSLSGHVIGEAAVWVAGCQVAVAAPALPPLARQQEGKNITGKKQYLHQRRNVVTQLPRGDCIDLGSWREHPNSNGAVTGQWRGFILIHPPRPPTHTQSRGFLSKGDEEK